VSRAPVIFYVRAVYTELDLESNLIFLLSRWSFELGSFDASVNRDYCSSPKLRASRLCEPPRRDRSLLFLKAGPVYILCNILIYCNWAPFPSSSSAAHENDLF
jgi:hypothetical protein